LKNLKTGKAGNKKPRKLPLASRKVMSKIGENQQLKK